MSRTVVHACMAAVITAVAVTGCTAAASSGSSGGGSGNSSGGVQMERELTDAEQMLVEQARELLVKDCMETEGFRYWPGPIASVEDRQGSGYVLDDVGWAHKHGYGTRLQDEVAAAQQKDPNHAYANALSEAERVRYSKTLDGDPSAGTLTAKLPAGGSIKTPRYSCQVEAKEELYGDFPAWFQAEKSATNLTGLYVPDLVKDERFVTALKAWSACMRQKGHDYAAPPAMREQLPLLTEGLNSEKAHAIEVKLAVAEATCATKDTSLVRTGRALEHEYRGRLRQYHHDIADYRRMQHAALERARGICAPENCAPRS